MLTSSDEKSRANAARQITVAAFHNKQAEDDLKVALAGDEHCRTAVADVFANNLGNEPVRAVCSQRIIPFFDDESKKVREAADNCFRHLSSEQLAGERGLIFAFIESRAFSDGLDTLVWALNESTALLPDVVCSIPEKVVSKHLAEHANDPIEQYGKVFGLPELVVRLYEQTQDTATKVRCLNSIDAMLELGFGSLESELQKIER
jgi:hypothetical protein